LPKIQKPSFTFSSFTDVKYYKGGFESKMSKREAALILGVSPNANIIKIKEAHKRIMLINHPDKGGSPFLSSKINEGLFLFRINS
jgi:DnaJ family protein C protein 19